MNENEKDKKPSVLKQSFDEVKAYFKGFRFDKPHLKAALPFFLEMLFFVFIITFDLVLKDYLYKFVVLENDGYYTVVEGFFALTYSENTGMGFGMGQNGTVGIIILTFIIVVAVIGYLLVFRKDKPYIRIPLVMVAAGGIGNLVDRIAFGYVRDFFEFTFMDFAIFNVADSFITVGAIVLIIGLIVMMATTTNEEKKKAAQTVAESEGDAEKTSTEGLAEKTEASESDVSAENENVSSAADGTSEQLAEDEKAKDGSENVGAKFTVAPVEESRDERGKASSDAGSDGEKTEDDGK